MNKKERFYHTALQLIHEKGFKAMTMRDLASNLSCDIKNLYNYTSSKPALLEYLISNISNEFHIGIDEVVSSKLDAKQQITELIRLHIELSYTKPLAVGLLINEWRNLSGKQLEEFVYKRKLYESKIAQALEKGIRDKTFRPMNVEVALAHFLGSLRSQYTYYFQQTAKPNLLDAVEELTQLILPGFLSKANPGTF